VRGRKYVVKKGKTPVLTAEEARELLDSIAIVRNTGRKGEPERSEPLLVGLRDRALIAAMVYSFARINAVLDMKVCDYFVQGRRGRVRLHEKGGKEHEVPCHHNLEHYLDEYIAAAGIAGRSGRALVPHGGRQDRRTDQQPDVAAGRLPDDSAPRRGRRHRDPHRQSHLPRHRHHHLPQEQRHP
jgi:site-specific recombinase XerC